MVDIEDLAPVPSVRERDIDLLVAHLASTSTEFVRWLLDTAQPTLGSRPPGTPTYARAVVNYSRPDAGGGATGETDVLIVAHYEQEQLLVSIENKAWAKAQPTQGERHRAFVEARDVTWAYAVVIAPTAWLANHRQETTSYHASIAIEDLAAWCSTHGHPFHAEVLTAACNQPEFAPALDLLSWHERANAHLAERFGLQLEPQRYVRTSNPGSAKPARWPSFARNTLPPLVEMSHPWLQIRPSSANHRCRLAVDLVKPPAHLVRHITAAVSDSGFTHRTTRAGTVIIELPVPDAERWDMSAPFEEQTGYLDHVARAARTFIERWTTLAKRFDETSTP